MEPALVSEEAELKSELMVFFGTSYFVLRYLNRSAGSALSFKGSVLLAVAPFGRVLLDKGVEAEEEALAEITRE